MFRRNSQLLRLSSTNGTDVADEPQSDHTLDAPPQPQITRVKVLSICAQWKRNFKICYALDECVSHLQLRSRSPTGGGGVQANGLESAFKGWSEALRKVVQQ